jgi:hypothetical protein
MDQLTAEKNIKLIQNSHNEKCIQINFEIPWIRARLRCVRIDNISSMTKIGEEIQRERILGNLHNFQKSIFETNFW